MRDLLVSLYPARWRERYGDEFGAILEERALGPFDVADILLGALDARLRFRGVGPQPGPRKAFPMSLRIGGIAAVIGAPLWTVGFMIANGVAGSFDMRVALTMLLVGAIALLVALVGLSAFQARTHPTLAWLAFAVPAIGTVALIVDLVGVASGREIGDLFFFGLLAFFLGSWLFAVATYRTAVLSRRAAALLGIAPVFAFAGGSGGGFADILILAGLSCFALGWMALGALAIRADRQALSWGRA